MITKSVRVLLIGCTLLVCAAHSVGAAQDGDVAPHFKPLPGETVGLLVWDIESALEAESRTGPPNVLGFASDTSSFRWVYVKCPEKSASKESLVVLVGEGKKRKRFDDVCLLDSDVAKHLNWEGPYRLVKVQVNGKEGSPANDTFVATEIQSVEQTTEYPLDVNQVVQAAIDELEKELEEQKRNIDRQMTSQTAKVLKGEKPTGPRENTRTVLPTWLPDAQHLRVLIRHQISDGRYRYATGTENKDVPKQEVPSKKHNGAVDEGIRYGLMFGVQIDAEFVFSKTGELISRKVSDPQPFTKELPPPE